MGHWSDDLLGEVAARVGPGADPEILRQVLRDTAREVELLAGRTFARVEQRAEVVNSGGLPFVDVGDAHAETLQSSDEIWPVRDPANPHLATVLQLARLPRRPSKSLPIVDALMAAGQLVGSAAEARRLTPEYMLSWLATNFTAEERMAYLREASISTNRCIVPVAAAMANGWWLQISRRIRWLLPGVPDDGRLVQPLIDEDGGLRALVGVEPILIAARVTEHPVEWAIAIRIWHNVARDGRRPWRYLAKAIHGHGIPIVSIDDSPNPAEIGGQLVLAAYWHGYIAKTESGLDTAIAAAYPTQVERVRRGAGLSDTAAAAALLLVRLLNPGFDPALGAGYAQRYVSRLATVTVHEARKLNDPGLRPWEQLGIGERYYYKLLRRFSEAGNRGYVVDAAVLSKLRRYLEAEATAKDTRQAALTVLMERGFSEAAARKWLQRHRLGEVLNAQPRRQKRSQTA